MNRTVSSNRAGGETFEGLLERLTRGAGSGDAQANLDSSFVSGSNAGAASLPGTRRRTLAPVAEAKSGESKADNMPLSYEKALRLHARRNLVADTDLRNSVEVDEAPRRRTSPATNQAINQVLIQDQEMASAKRRARRPQAASAGAGSQVDASTPAKLRSDSRTAARKNPSGRPDPQSAAQSSGQSSARSSARSRATQPSTACSPANAAKVHKTLSHSKSSKNAGAAIELKAQSAHLSRVTRAKTADSVPGPGRQLARRDTTQPEELRLEHAHTNLQLEHRHAVVSIRLNDSEIERLRQRAAESGISVSAYMRSCVLEAEHLRAQVKQALAEMRASIQPIALLSGSGIKANIDTDIDADIGAGISTGGGGAWSRLLWKSATFLLGPWFFFRHRA